MTAVLGVSIAFYVWFAIDIFKKDKSAYIYENSYSHTENMAGQTSLYLRDVGNRLQLLTTAFGRTRDKSTLRSLLEKSQDFIDFSVFRRGDQVISICNKENPENEEICSDPLDKYLLDIREQKNQVYIKSVGDLGVVPRFIFSLKNQDEIYIIRVNMGELNKILDQNNLYNSYLINKSGSIFYHKDLKLALSESGIPQKKEVLKSISGGINKGTLESVNEKQASILMSYSEVPGFEKFIISEISKEKAFSAARYLINKSFYFALLVLALALILGIFFARSVTAHINKLFMATQSIAKRDFNTRVMVKSKDEVGVLADSFNFMSSEILRYMDEMEEKARLENEMKVASLVQTAFFPKSEIQTANISISAFYTPATECGGDWWGHIENGNKTILILADATGHGVPAALLTATINSSASMIENFAKKDPSLLNSPEAILNLMNHSVCSVGADIMLTCFVGIIDGSTRVMTYANASHNPPLLLKDKDGEITKNDFIPLTKALGPRLGHDQAANFTNERVELSDNDLLVLYTDGLTECENTEGKQWGKRRFLQALAKNSKETPQKIKDNIIMEMNNFIGEVPNEDDITLIVSKLHL